MSRRKAAKYPEQFDLIRAHDSVIYEVTKLKNGMYAFRRYGNNWREFCKYQSVIDWMLARGSWYIVTPDEPDMKNLNLEEIL